jgi:hypothetical protein
MKARLTADEVMLGTPLHEILQAWCLEDAGVVKETHFWVHPNLYSSFDSSQLPYQAIQGTTDDRPKIPQAILPPFPPGLRSSLKLSQQSIMT